MVGIVGSFVRTLLLGYAICRIYPLPAMAQRPDSLASILIGEADTGLLEEAIEDSWNADGVWRTRWQRPAAIPASHAGGASGMQSRLHLRTGSVTLGVLVEKNPGEPWGPTRQAPWRGPERKRMSLQLTQERWGLVLGPFRQQLGFGLVAGRSDGWAPALSSPLRQPAILPRAGARIGLAGVPIASGFSLQMHGPRGSMGIFHGQSRHAASVGRKDGRPWLVVGPSTTTVFATPSALERRRQLGMAWSGWTGSLQGNRWQIATLQTLVRAESRLMRDGLPVPLAFNAQRYWSTVAGRLTLGAFDALTEWAATSGTSLHEWSLRWRAAPGMGLRIGRAAHHGAARSPFGGDARFQTDWTRTERWNAAATWRNAAHILTLIGALQSRTATTRERKQRIAFSWTWRSNPKWSLSSFAVRDFDLDRRWRVGSRFTHGLEAHWRLESQFQIGIRKDSTPMRRLSTLQTIGARWFNSGWDLHFMVLRRMGQSGATVLYAVVPAVTNGFPVLGGASRRWIGMVRIRRQMGKRFLLESWSRLDLAPGGASMEWQAQGSISL